MNGLVYYVLGGAAGLFLFALCFGFYMLGRSHGFDTGYKLAEGVRVFGVAAAPAQVMQKSMEATAEPGLPPGVRDEADLIAAVAEGLEKENPKLGAKKARAEAQRMVEEMNRWS